MKDINILLENFIIMLCNNWQQIEKLLLYDRTGSLKDDWLQANWELLVEGLIMGNKEMIFLEVYGDGADANGESSRILYPKSLPTHTVYCEGKKDIEILDCLENKKIIIPNMGVRFEKFVSMDKNGWYMESPPFDKILAFLEEREIVVKISDIRFKLVKNK